MLLIPKGEHGSYKLNLSLPSTYSLSKPRKKELTNGRPNKQEIQNLTITNNLFKENNSIYFVL